MMQWMRGYKKPEPTAEGISYLENQYESVQVVSQKIDSAITKGQYILQY
jgi:uracil phosphoribosyltransferase